MSRDHRPVFSVPTPSNASDNRRSSLPLVLQMTGQLGHIRRGSVANVRGLGRRGSSVASPVAAGRVAAHAVQHGFIVRGAQRRPSMADPGIQSPISPKAAMMSSSPSGYDSGSSFLSPHHTAAPTLQHPPHMKPAQAPSTFLNGQSFSVYNLNRIQSRPWMNAGQQSRRAIRTATQHRLRMALADVGQSLRDMRVVDAVHEGGGDQQQLQPQSLPWYPPRGDKWQKLYMIMDNPSSCRAAQVFSGSMMCAILVAAVAFVLESLPEFRIGLDKGGDRPPVFFWLEVVTIAMFSLEYIGRALTVWAAPAVYLDPGTYLGIWERNFASNVEFNIPAAHGCAPASLENSHEAAVELERQTTASRKLWLFIKSPANFLDLLAVIPFYLEIIFTSFIPGLAVIRTLRLTRVFRLFKFGKYSSSVRLLSRVLATSREALYLMLFFSCLGMVVFGTIIFYCEAGTLDESTGMYMRPNIRGSGEEESPFTSIIQSFYWVLVSATTVGYGDLVPTTPAGKITSAVLTHFGILALALPITVIGANFAVEYSMEDPVEEDKWLEHALDAIEEDRLKNNKSAYTANTAAVAPSGRADGRTQERLPPKHPPVIAEKETKEHPKTNAGDANKGEAKSKAPNETQPKEKPQASEGDQKLAKIVRAMQQIVGDTAKLQARALHLSKQLQDMQEAAAAATDSSRAGQMDIQVASPVDTVQNLGIGDETSVDGDDNTSPFA